MSESLRLMTVNLLAGAAKPEALLTVLDRFEPDVVVTQELGQECAEALRDRFPNHRLKPAVDSSGGGIATTLAARFGDIPMPGRDGTWADIEFGRGDLSVAGVHLLNPVEFPWWRSVRGRGIQLGVIRQWVEGQEGPTVVAGDFNASPRWPVYKEMTSMLTDLPEAFASEAGERPERTWAWRPGWPRVLRIDHVFGSEVEAVGTYVARIEGSDHHAVVVDLRERIDPGPPRTQGSQRRSGWSGTQGSTQAPTPPRTQGSHRRSPWSGTQGSTQTPAPSTQAPAQPTRASSVGD